MLRQDKPLLLYTNFPPYEFFFSQNVTIGKKEQSIIYCKSYHFSCKVSNVITNVCFHIITKMKIKFSLVFVFMLYFCLFQVTITLVLVLSTQAVTHFNQMWKKLL